MKICNKCDKTKFYEEYHKCKANKDGYNNKCKECLRIMVNGYAKRHVEEDPLYHHKRYKQQVKKDPVEYRASRLRRTNRWMKNNRERYLQLNRNNQKNRRAKMLGFNPVPLNEINKLIEDSNNICFWCDKDIDVMHLDHIYPLSKNGDHSISNLCVSCADCNMRKHNKDPEVFLEEILQRAI